ncbi:MULTISPECIES: DUF4180 domain-containing protein [unclassified Streptomyces]|uniref:DUF4180 domain-containing protein n=1 Tax=unclassified Streptomyces TaxID=2593676 RepID=UPI0037153F52
MTTPATLVTPHTTRVLRCAPEGPAPAGESAALDLLGDAMGRDAELVAVPVERISEESFRLRSGVAGAAAGSALRDFVHEANRGRRLWFVADDGEPEQRLRPTE